jgi:hypothetical protein
LDCRRRSKNRMAKGLEIGSKKIIDGLQSSKFRNKMLST